MSPLRWFRSKPKPSPRLEDEAVLWLGDKDCITLGQSFESILVTGGSGSGKTSAVGAQLLYRLLKLGCSIVVFTVKSSEYQKVKKICDEAGRECIRFAPDEKWRLDILDYASKVMGSVDEMMGLIDSLIGLASRKNRGGQSQEAFWEMLAKRILRCALTAVRYGNDKCSFTDLFAFVTSMPTEPEQLRSEAWVTGSFAGQCLMKALSKPITPEVDREVTIATDFMEEWVGLSEKTRSVGYTLVLNVLSQFLAGDIAKLCSSGETSITVEDIYSKGLVVCIDVPILVHREPGQYLQLALKSLMQRLILKRDVTKHPIPFVLWQDEAAWLVDRDADSLFLSVGRESRAITVAMAQNLPLLYSAFGSADGGQTDGLAWLGNLGTKIACSNSCEITNRYWESLCGHSRHMFMSGSTSNEYDLFDDLMYGSVGKTTGGFSEQWHPNFPASWFTALRKGGAPHFCVDVVVFQSGRVWSNGQVFLPTVIQQRI